jgi:hypothetical protein
MVAGTFGGVVRRQKRIVAAFRAAGAVGRERATTAAALGIQEGLAFRTLRRHGILREEGERKHFLDEAGWEAHQLRRRRIALIILSVVVVLFAVLAVWVSRR